MTARDDYPSLAWWADRRHNDDDDEPRPKGMRSITRAALDEIDRLRAKVDRITELEAERDAWHNTAEAWREADERGRH